LFSVGVKVVVGCRLPPKRPDSLHPAPEVVRSSATCLWGGVRFHHGPRALERSADHKWIREVTDRRDKRYGSQRTNIPCGIPNIPGGICKRAASTSYREPKFVWNPFCSCFCFPC